MMKTTFGALTVLALAAYGPVPACAQTSDSDSAQTANDLPQGDDRAGFLRKRPAKIERDTVIEADDTVGYLRKRPSKLTPEGALPQGDDRAGFLRKRPAKIKPDEAQPGTVDPERF